MRLLCEIGVFHVHSLGAEEHAVGGGHGGVGDDLGPEDGKKYHSNIFGLQKF